MSTLTNPAKWFVDWVAGVSNVGGRRSPPITADTIAGTASGWYSINKICGHVGQMPLEVYRETKDGKEKAKNHPAYRLMRQRPNALMTPMIFKETVQTHALLWGNGRCAIVRNNAGQPTEVLPMHPDNTSTALYEGEKWHITRPASQDRVRMYDKSEFVVLPDRDVLHVPGLGFDGLVGKSVIDLARESFTVSSEADRRSAKQMREGFRGRLMLEAPKGMFRTEADAQLFLKEFKKNHKGEDGDDTGLLREGIKTSILNMSNKDAQFIATRQYQREDAALWFLVESMLGVGNDSYNSLEQKNLNYLTNCLMRWLKKWEEECNEKLLSDNEKKDHYFKFNTASLLRADFQTTVNTLGNGISSRIFSPNEARAKLDMNSYDGGDAFENPAITPGQTGTTETEDGGTNAKLTRLEHMMGVEQKRVQSFLDSGATMEKIEKWYGDWQPKLSTVIVEELGGKSCVAMDHCRANIKYLSAGRSTFDLTGTAELLLSKIEGTNEG